MAETVRENARRIVPDAWRGDMRLLGDLLGRVLVEAVGQDLLDDVEKLRRIVIAARESDDFERQADDLVTSWSLERAELVARAFTCYFHLANLAEERHRARTLRHRDRDGDSAPPESLAATAEDLAGSGSVHDLQARFETVRIHPVLTAHPTEARRRAVVAAIRRVGLD